MKTTLLLLTALTAAIAVNARTLSPAEAIARLQSDASAAKAPAVKAIATGKPKLVHTVNTRSGMPAVYLFENNADSRLLIVAADDVATPLLGYTDRPVTDVTEMPPQLKWWLSEYAREIAYAQQNGVTYTETTTAPGAVVAHATDTRQPIGPLLTTQWAQGEPYNDDCPKYGTATTVTGCVATAMAQFMKYFEYPEKGTGNCHAFTSFNDSEPSLDLGNITFDWANMRDYYNRNDNSTEAERKAVSQLMVACGYSVNTSYGTGGSGATFSDIARALNVHFDYDAGTVVRAYYSRKDWENIIYNNLAKIGPVCYAGRTTNTGHAFVCDGYSTDGFFHFNWGWGGSSDGYYTLQALNPGSYDIEDAADGYNFMQEAVFGIPRPTGSTTTILPQLTNYGGLTGNYSDGMLTIAGGFYNFTGKTISVDIYVKFSPVNGGEDIRYCAIRNSNLTAGNSHPALSVPINSVNLPDGTYDVSIETTAANNTDIYYSLQTPDEPHLITLTKEGTAYTVSNDSGDNASITFTELFSELYYDGSSYLINVNPQVSYTIKNTSTHEAAGGLAFQIVDGTKVIGYSTGTSYDLMPGESISEKMQVGLMFRDRPTIGKTYDLYRYNPNISFSPNNMTSSQKISTVTFVEYPGATLTGSGLAIVGDPQAVNPAEISFSGNVQCTSGVYVSTIIASIVNTLDWMTVESRPIAAFNLKESESATYSYTMRPYPALEPDTDYALWIDDNGLIIDHIIFHTAKSAGVDDITADSAESISITTDGATRTATISSAATISNVTVVGISGAAVNATVSYQGTSAVVDMEHLPAGIYVISAIDADGKNATSKVALR